MARSQGNYTLFLLAERTYADPPFTGRIFPDTGLLCLDPYYWSGLKCCVKLASLEIVDHTQTYASSSYN